MSNPQMPANAVFSVLASAFSCLISEVQKKGAVDATNVVHNIRETAEAQRATGDPDNVANYLLVLSNYIVATVPPPPTLKSLPSMSSPRPL